MRYEEKLKGYQALLAELESGLEFFDPQFEANKLASTKIRDTAPKWVYVEAHQENSVFYFPQDGGPYTTLLLKYERGGDDHELGYEIARQEVIEWVKACISEGPPKPKLEWVEHEDKRWHRTHFIAFAPANSDGSIGFALRATHNWHWKGQDESYAFCVCTISADTPVGVWDINHNAPGSWILEASFGRLPDGGYPAPFLEAEEALHNLLSAALDALNNPKP